MKKAYFQYYETFENIVMKLKTTEEQKYFREVIIRYGLYGEEPAGLNDTMDIAFTVIKELIDDQKRRRETNAENRRTDEPEEELPKTKRFVKPSVEEVANYCLERNNGINAQSFVDFYESKNWKVGNSAMKDWKACVRTWEQRRRENNKSDLPEGRLTL